MITVRKKVTVLLDFERARDGRKVTFKLNEREANTFLDAIQNEAPSPTWRVFDLEARRWGDRVLFRVTDPETGELFMECKDLVANVYGIVQAALGDRRT